MKQHITSNWTKIEWQNSYALYKAANLYELDDYLEFSDFKKKMLTDDDFLNQNKLKEGMNEENYNPWKTKTKRNI